MPNGQERSTDVNVHEASQELTPAQEVVIGQLLAGKTQAEAAETGGVAPETVSRWKSTDSLFVAVWSNRRRQMWEAHAQRLENLAARALDVIEARLDEGDLRAAALVLKSVSLESLEVPDEDITPTQVAWRWEARALFTGGDHPPT